MASCMTVLQRTELGIIKCLFWFLTSDVDLHAVHAQKTVEKIKTLQILTEKAFTVFLIQILVKSILGFFCYEIGEIIEVSK